MSLLPDQDSNAYAQPFFFPGHNDEACLLTHGFTGTPAHMRLLGEALHQAGYTVSGIRLQGHGTRWEDLTSVTWQDWLHDVRSGLRDLTQQYRRVHVMGLSMGGVLSLLLAQEYPVSSVVTLAAAMKLPSRLPSFAPLIKFIRPYVPWEPRDPLPGTATDYLIGYSGVSTKAVSNLLTLMRMARRNLKKVTAPILVVQPKLDETIRPVSATIIFNQVSSPQRDILWLPNSSHVCTLGPEREVIHGRVLAFLQQVSSGRDQTASTLKAGV